MFFGVYCRSKLGYFQGRCWLLRVGYKSWSQHLPQFHHKILTRYWRIYSCFSDGRRLRQSGVAKQRISAHSENFVVNGRFIVLDPVTPVVKILMGNGFRGELNPLANIRNNNHKKILIKPPVRLKSDVSH